MADNPISIDVRDGPLISGLHRAARVLGDGMRPVYELVGLKAREIVKDHIRHSVTPEGRPMDRLKYPRARGHKQDATPLWDTGRLLRSITYRAEKDKAIVGTDVIYAAVHHFGHKFPARVIRPKRKQALFWPGAEHPVMFVNHPAFTVPARPYMGLGLAEQKSLLAIAEPAITRRVRAALEGGAGA